MPRAWHSMPAASKVWLATEKILSLEMIPYFPNVAQLSVEKGLLLRGGRIAVAQPLKKIV